MLIELDEDDKIRFFKHVYDKRKEECWPWLLVEDKDGYGRFFLKGKNQPAHRVAYFLHYGIQPNELKVCHTCDNPPCCNPHHLFLGTQQENVTDCVIKGRRNYLYGERHQNTKYSDELIAEIREEWNQYGKNYGSMTAFAAHYDIRQSVMWKILNFNIRNYNV